MGSRPLQCGKRYHASLVRSVTDFAVVRGEKAGFLLRVRAAGFGRFCCKSDLKILANSDFPSLAGISVLEAAMMGRQTDDQGHLS